MILKGKHQDNMRMIINWSCLSSTLLPRDSSLCYMYLPSMTPELLEIRINALQKLNASNDSIRRSAHHLTGTLQTQQLNFAFCPVSLSSSGKPRFHQHQLAEKQDPDPLKDRTSTVGQLYNSCLTSPLLHDC